MKDIFFSFRFLLILLINYKNGKLEWKKKYLFCRILNHSTRFSFDDRPVCVASTSTESPWKNEKSPYRTKKTDSDKPLKVCFNLIIQLYQSVIVILHLFLTEGRPIDTDLKKKAVALQKALDWEDAGPEMAAVLGGTDTGIKP